jgi:hypothetical protein
MGIAAGLALGCTSATGDGAGPIRLRVQTANTTFQSGLPATLDVALGTVASAFQLGLSAPSERGTWSAYALLTRDQALAGQANLAIGTTGSAAAGVQISGATTVVASTGTLDLTFGAGKIQGTATGTSSDFLDGSFAGDLAVSCWVPAAGVDASGGTFDPDGGSEALVMDPTFATTACMPFKPLGN